MKNFNRKTCNLLDMAEQRTSGKLKTNNWTIVWSQERISIENTKKSVRVIWRIMIQSNMHIGVLSREKW